MKKFEYKVLTFGYGMIPDEKRVVKEKCEKLFRGFLLKAFLKSASNEPFDQEGEFKKLMDKI